MKIVKTIEDRTLDISQPVRVFRNLSPQYRKHPVYSVQQKHNGTWRTVLHVRNIGLVDVTFVVSQKGVERIRQTGHKQIVATIHGYIPTQIVAPFASREDIVYFNPHKLRDFVVLRGGNFQDQHVLDSAAYVFVEESDDKPHIVVIGWEK